MNRLQQRFDELKQHERKVLVPYLTAGYPDAAATVAVLTQLDPARLGCVELGIPFSDPIADGPVIQTSFSRALDGGFRLTGLFEALAAARGDIAVPLVAMVSYSIVYRRAPERFIEAAQAAGVDGMLVPDLSFEEAAELAELGRRHDFPLVLIVAPTSDARRREQIATLSAPWIYYQSLAGVTGERASLPPQLADNVAALRQATGKPVCVGFGISTPEQVGQVCGLADGAIVGSAIVRQMNAAVDEGLSRDALVNRVTGKIAELAAGVPV